VLNKENVGIQAVEPIGHYAVRLVFDDGHSTGLYTWQYLYELGAQYASKWSAYIARRARAAPAAQAAQFQKPCMPAAPIQRSRPKGHCPLAGIAGKPCCSAKARRRSAAFYILPVIPGWSEGPDLRCAMAHRGISRFSDVPSHIVVRIFDAPRNDHFVVSPRPPPECRAGASSRSC
jgi:hypothetical protein